VALEVSAITCKACGANYSASEVIVLKRICRCGNYIEPKVLKEVPNEKAKTKVRTVQPKEPKLTRQYNRKPKSPPDPNAPKRKHKRRDPSAQTEYDRKYYACNRERMLKYLRDRRAANPEVEREKKRVYYAENAETIKKRNSEYYWQNKAHIKEMRRRRREYKAFMELATDKQLLNISKDWIDRILYDLKSDYPKAFLLDLRVQLIRSGYELLVQHLGDETDTNVIDTRATEIISVGTENIVKRIHRQYSETQLD
jgi:hypothetical protein